MTAESTKRHNERGRGEQREDSTGNRRYRGAGMQHTEDEGDQVLVREFGVGTVSDVAQTEGEPFPEPPQPEIIDGASVVLNHYSIDSSGYSFPYIARWAQDKAVFKANLDVIQQVSHEIICTLEGTGERVLFARERRQ